MSLVPSVDSNITGLRYAFALANGTLDPTPANQFWRDLEPNSFGEWGGKIKTIARNPLNPSRQRKKGTAVDVDASGSFNTDLTQNNLQELLQSFFYAGLRRKAEYGLRPELGQNFTSVTTSNDRYTAPTLSGFRVGDLVFGSTFGDSTNDGLKHVTTAGAPVAASGTLTIATYASNNAVNNETVTINGLVYTWKTVINNGNAREVLIDTNGAASLANLSAAITAGAGSGTKYSSATTANATVSAGAVNVGVSDADLTVTARAVGAAGNAITTTETMTNGVWSAVTLTSGADGYIGVDTNLVDELTPATGVGSLVAVGFQFGTGDAVINVAGALPKLTTTVKDLTQLGVGPGEFVYIGGDSAGLKFATAADNGWVRVRSVTTNAMTFDKTSADMTADSGTGKTVQLFVGRLLKNESGTSIARFPLWLERTLGASNDADITKEQAEYLKTALGNQITFTFKPGDKITVDASFIANDADALDENDVGVTLRSKVGGVNRLAVVEADAFNTSSNFTRVRLAKVVDGDTFPDRLFTYAEDMTLVIDNGVKPNKALGVFGAFSMSLSDFAVSGNINAYFGSVAGAQSVRANDDITLDFAMVKANAGVMVDLPLIALGGGNAQVTKDEPIKLPLENAAATGAKINANLNHTLSMVFFDYLPDAAEVAA